MWWRAVLQNNAIKGTGAPNGLAYHFSDMYVEELTNVGKELFTQEQVCTEFRYEILCVQFLISWHPFYLFLFLGSSIFGSLL